LRSPGKAIATIGTFVQVTRRETASVDVLIAETSTAATANDSEENAIFRRLLAIAYGAMPLASSARRPQSPENSETQSTYISVSTAPERCSRY
jgi:hypothetical protein